MRKRDELSDPRSCLNRAKSDEWVFTLLGRDAAAADTVRFWIQKRIALGKNEPDDAQIAEAKAWISAVIAEHGHPYQSRSVGALEEVMRDERERIARRIEEQGMLLNTLFPDTAGRHDALIADLVRMVRADHFRITAPLAGKKMAETKESP